VAPTGTFRIDIGVEQPPPGAKLQARLYRKVANQNQLQRTGQGELLGSTQQLVTVPLDAAPASQLLELSFPIVASGSPPPTAS
jgi:hypothetical protein